MPRDRFGLLIVDEAHHTPALMYQRVLDHFNVRRFLLGATATPTRLDGQGLADWYGPEALYTLSIRDAVDAGVLVPPRQYKIETGTNLDAVGVRGGDFAEGELARVVNNADQQPGPCRRLPPARQRPPRHPVRR